MLLNAIFLIVAGALGAAGFILNKRPDAKPLFEKLAPFQGIIGIVALAWGVWGLINVILNMGILMKASMVAFVISLVGSLSLFGTGFLLGFSLIANAMGKNPDAAAKADQLRSKLVAYQIPMGFVCIGLGVLSLVFAFM